MSFRSPPAVSLRAAAEQPLRLRAVMMGPGNRNSVPGREVGPSRCMVSLLSRLTSGLDFLLVESLVFTVPKTIAISVKDIGILHRTCQAGALLYVFLYSIIAGSSWAYTESTVGMVNAWAEDGLFLHHTEHPNATELAYCSNPDFSYAYSPSFVMDDPVCEQLHGYEIANKALNELAFTTAFIEVRQVAWPVPDATADTSESAACALRGGIISNASAAQRLCTSSRTVYPLGVSLMAMAFEHGLNRIGGDSRFDQFQGHSNVPVGEPGALKTTIIGANGMTLVSPPGAAVRQRVDEWLEMADVSIDAPNLHLTADYRGTGAFPRFRSAGVLVDVLVDYSNKGTNGRPQFPTNDNVQATITLKAAKDAWAGKGAITHYNAYPSGPAGAQSWDKIFRYRQDVIFSFRTTGTLYTFDLYLLLNVIIRGIVLFGLANVITSVYALYLHPKSSMIYKNTAEQFDVNKELSSIGMKSVKSGPRPCRPYRPLYAAAPTSLSYGCLNSRPSCS